MKKDIRKRALETCFYLIVAGITFGFWKCDVTAGLFMIVLLLAIAFAVSQMLEIFLETQYRAAHVEAELEFIKTGAWPEGWGPEAK